jgi:hypothetical protein
VYQGTPESTILIKQNKMGYLNKKLAYSFYIFKCPFCGNEVSILDKYHLDYPFKRYKNGNYDDYHYYLKSLDRDNNTTLYEDYITQLRIQIDKVSKILNK